MSQEIETATPEQVAYGLLWLSQSPDPLVREARRRLAGALSRDQRIAAVGAAGRVAVEMEEGRS